MPAIVPLAGDALVPLVVALGLSPLLAGAAVVVLKIVGWVAYFLPGLGRYWGWARIAFLWTFSRLIVEPTPELEMPAWLGR